MRATIKTIALLSTLCLAAPAFAGPSSHMLLAYGKVGGLIPFKLGPNAQVRLGVGYVPPILKRRLGLIVDLGYSATPKSNTVSDPRLGDNGGSWSYDLTQKDLDLFIGPIGFILDPAGSWVPYVSVGVHIHFLKSVIEGDGAGQPLGSNSETSTKAGFAARAGLGYRLGPGTINLEVSFAWAPLSHDITGTCDTVRCGDNTGTLGSTPYSSSSTASLARIAILAGYTFMIGR